MNKKYIVIEKSKVVRKIVPDWAKELDEGFYGIRVRRRGDESKVLVVSTGIGLEHALGIAKNGYNTYYAVVHARAFPTVTDEIDGYGFNEIKKVWDWGQGLEEGCETIIMTDSGFGAIADWLRIEGFNVFGADNETEKMELDRVYFKNIMNKLGIKTPNYDVAKGVEELKSIIEKKGKRYIKVNRFRGSVETFATDEPDEVETRILMSEFGIFGNVATFLAEEPVGDEYVEIGFDALFNGEKFLDIVFDTLEKKGCGNITIAREIDNSPWYSVLKRFEPYLRKNGYRGFFCAEGFWNGKEILVTDITPRFAYVCSYAYPRMIENYGDVIVRTAKGSDVEIKLRCRYSAQVGMYTDELKWKKLKNVNYDVHALRRGVRVGDELWWMPIDDNTVVVAIGCGENISEVISKAIESAESVEVNNIYHCGHRLKSLFEKDEKRLVEYGWV